MSALSVRPLILLAGLALSPALLAAPARANTIDPEAEYIACLKLAQKDPKTAIEQAGQWEGLGGGTPATQCRAVATDNAGDHRAAAVMLEDLATKARATAEIKAGLLRQAAQAWVKDGQIDRAMGVLNAALKVDPHMAALYEDRAVLQAQQGHLWKAIDDLNSALDNDPKRVSSLVLRAAAYRRLKTPDLAKVDIERAKSLAPKSPDVWLEAGNLAFYNGHTDQARDDWMMVLQLAPKSASATVAQQNIQNMDLKTKPSTNTP